MKNCTLKLLMKDPCSFKVIQGCHQIRIFRENQGILFSIKENQGEMRNVLENHGTSKFLIVSFQRSDFLLSQLCIQLSVIITKFTFLYVILFYIVI